MTLTMTIYVRDWQNKWVYSNDNYPCIMRFHIMLAKSRIWQLLSTPKHILLGAVYGYTSRDIWAFVTGNVKAWL